MGIERGDEVIEPLNKIAALFAAGNGRIIATQDWHPENHVSFAASHEKSREAGAGKGIGEEVFWPKHCVQGSKGAELHKDLDTSCVHLILRKGFRPGLDSYSAFFENDRKTATGLDGYLKSLSIDTIVIGGLAADYCVLYSAMDAASLAYKTIVIEEAVRGVNIPAGSVERAFELLEKAGVIIE